MCIGEQRILTIPPHLGYGDHGFPPIIPSNSTLTFQVQLVYISRRKKQNWKKSAMIQNLIATCCWNVYFRWVDRINFHIQINQTALTSLLILYFHSLNIWLNTSFQIQLITMSKSCSHGSNSYMQALLAEFDWMLTRIVLNLYVFCGLLYFQTWVWLLKGWLGWGDKSG